ncbi:MAG: glycosyltransferase family 2 protein [Proteobacteria bacterium]|nr:glycosyltransferase family 2 protein [Pseudomonadota bacterium]
MKTLSIVVPVYYNEDSLPDLFEELLRVESKLLEMGLNLELIFVDDGSGDDSFQELKKIKAARPATRVIKLTRNFGSIHASKAGIQFVTGDCFTVLAADLQDPPELLLEMAEKWLAGSKFVLCERISREDPWTSRMFSSLYYRIIRFFVIPDYPQGGFDAMLMDKVMLSYIQESSKNLYMPLLAYWLGFEPTIIPYHRRQREKGTSRWTFKKKFDAFLDVILGFSITPIRMVSGVGLIVACVSFLYGGFIFVNGLLGRTEVAGFASIVTLITFLLGLIIVMLGVIGEYLSRIFREIDKRPETVIDEIL